MIKYLKKNTSTNRINFFAKINVENSNKIHYTKFNLIFKLNGQEKKT